MTDIQPVEHEQSQSLYTLSKTPKYVREQMKSEHSHVKYAHLKFCSIMLTTQDKHNPGCLRVAKLRVSLA